MTRELREATGAGRRALRIQWIQFESTHPGAALLLSSLAVLVACGAVLGAVALLPMPSASAS